MNWTKDLPQTPGYYWILDHDEDGSALMNVVEIVEMPQDRALIEEFLECEDNSEVDALLGKLVILSMGDAYVQLLDELSGEDLSWYGPLDQPEVPAE